MALVKVAKTPQTEGQTQSQDKKPTVTVVKIPSTLEGQNLARLKAKKYKSSFTEVPNSVLPNLVRDPLARFFTCLTGESFSVEGYTYLVSADGDGSYKRQYGPALYRKADSGLVIKWGDTSILVAVNDEGVLSIPSCSVPKVKLQIKDEQVNGYMAVVLSVSLTLKDNEVNTMVFPIKLIDINTNSDTLNAMLETDVDHFLNMIMELPTKGSSSKMSGPVIKISDLPLGSYNLSAYRSYENQFGVKYLAQIEPIDEPFEAFTRAQDENGNWINKQITIDGPFIIRSNSKLEMHLQAAPVVSQESPATLTILEKSMFNDHPAVKIAFVSPEYAEGENLFSLDF